MNRVALSWIRTGQDDKTKARLPDVVGTAPVVRAA